MAEPRVAAPVDSADGGNTGSRSVADRWLRVVGRTLGSRLVRWGFVAAALSLAGYALARDWDPIRRALGHLGWWPVAGALVSVLLAYAVTVQVWRLLLGSLGSPLPYRAAAKVLLVGQIGKYVPGSIWPVLASMELGKAHQVPRSRSASASVLQMLLSVITGLLTALVTLPFVAGSVPYWWALLAVPVLLAVLHPRALNAIISWLLRLARQPPLDGRVTAGALARAMAWSVASWLCYGLQIWILATRLGAPLGKAAVVALGAFAFAWSVGFVVVLAPAGAGVRDVLLLVLLGPVLRTADGTAVVLVSRGVTTVADLVSAAVAARTVRRPPPPSVGDRRVGADLP